MSTCQQCEMPLGSTQADECQVCSAYLAGRRSAFRSIAREARRTAKLWAGVDSYGTADALREIARLADRRARGAS